MTRPHCGLRIVLALVASWTTCHIAHGQIDPTQSALSALAIPFSNRITDQDTSARGRIRALLNAAALALLTRSATEPIEASHSLLTALTVVALLPEVETLCRRAEGGSTSEKALLLRAANQMDIIGVRPLRELNAGADGWSVDAALREVTEPLRALTELMDGPLASSWPSTRADADNTKSVDPCHAAIQKAESALLAVPPKDLAAIAAPQKEKAQRALEDLRATMEPIPTADALRTACELFAHQTRSFTELCALGPALGLAESAGPRTRQALVARIRRASSDGEQFNALLTSLLTIAPFPGETASAQVRENIRTLFGPDGDAFVQRVDAQRAQLLVSISRRENNPSLTQSCQSASRIFLAAFELTRLESIQSKRLDPLLCWGGWSPPPWGRLDDLIRLRGTIIASVSAFARGDDAAAFKSIDQGTSALADAVVMMECLQVISDRGDALPPLHRSSLARALIPPALNALLANQRDPLEWFARLRLEAQRAHLDGRDTLANDLDSQWRALSATLRDSIRSSVSSGAEPAVPANSLAE
ncbi:MAG: hypothetical protein O2800_06080 [Planctomycetota bacterium]|nr:hypothetical protein [Planctomycetota bacterium]